MEKRGISAVVAIVLMILIVVAAVGVLYAGIFPMFSDNDIKASRNSISIDTQGGYTLYDEKQKIACVQVKKETSDEIEGLKVLFSVDGNSHSTTVSKDDVPEINQKKTYCFNLTNFGKPNSVTVVTLPENEGIVVSAIISAKELTMQALGTIIGGGSPGALRLDDDPDKGIIPKEIITYYFDRDLDGYSNGSISKDFEEGTQWANYTLNIGDCDDSNPARNFGAVEIYQNAVDENCNGLYEMNDCSYIDYPGSYLLVNDLNNLDENVDLFERACFFVRANGVKIDLGGHTIHAINWDSSPSGVRTDDYDDFVLTNGTIIHFSSGIFSNGGVRVNITNMNFSGNFRGIFLFSLNNLFLNHTVSCGNGDRDMYCLSCNNLFGSGNNYTVSTFTSCTNNNLQSNLCYRL